MANNNPSGQYIPPTPIIDQGLEIIGTNDNGVITIPGLTGVGLPSGTPTFVPYYGGDGSLTSDGGFTRTNDTLTTTILQQGLRPGNSAGLSIGETSTTIGYISNSVSELITIDNNASSIDITTPSFSMNGQIGATIDNSNITTMNGVVIGFTASSGPIPSLYQVTQIGSTVSQPTSIGSADNAVVKYSGVIKIGDPEGNLNGTVLEVNDNSSTISGNGFIQLENLISASVSSNIIIGTLSFPSPYGDIEGAFLYIQNQTTSDVAFSGVGDTTNIGGSTETFAAGHFQASAGNIAYFFADNVSSIPTLQMISSYNGGDSSLIQLDPDNLQINVATFSMNGNPGFNGTYSTGDGTIATVTNGIITSIV